MDSSGPLGKWVLLGNRKIFFGCRAVEAFRSLLTGGRTKKFLEFFYREDYGRPFKTAGSLVRRLYFVKEVDDE